MAWCLAKYLCTKYEEAVKVVDINNKYSKCNVNVNLKYLGHSSQRICLICRNEHAALREKLQNLEKKILVGGENLLEKAEVQEQLLEASAHELEQRRCKEEQLRQALQQKEVQYHSFNHVNCM
jgi:hypothetical protein